MIIVEVLNKMGKVQSRTHHQSLPIRIGRAYENNDVILDDEYVSPNHLVIESEANGPINIKDLHSENGLYLIPSKQRISQVKMGDETLLRIGHSILRLRTSTFVIPPTKQDQEYILRVLQAFQHPWTFMGIMALTGMWLFLSTYWNTFSKPEMNELVMIPLWSMVALSVWAGCWAMMSKLNLQSYNYKIHFCIACLALLSSSLLGTLYEYYVFAFSISWSGDIFWWVANAALVGAILGGHLRFCTALAPTRIVLTAGGIAFGIMGLFSISWYVASTQLTSMTNYHGELKPPAFRVANSLKLDEFINAVQPLKERTDSSIHEER